MREISKAGLSVRLSCKMMSLLNVTELILVIFQVNRLGRAHIISWCHLAACNSDHLPFPTPKQVYFSQLMRSLEMVSPGRSGFTVSSESQSPSVSLLHHPQGV